MQLNAKLNICMRLFRRGADSVEKFHRAVFIQFKRKSLKRCGPVRIVPQCERAHCLFSTRVTPARNFAIAFVCLFCHALHAVEIFPALCALAFFLPFEPTECFPALSNGFMFSALSSVGVQTAESLFPLTSRALKSPFV